MWYRDKSYFSFWNGFDIPQKTISERKYNLLQLAQSVRDLPGDTAECGVYAGEGSFLIMKATATDKIERHHHIFDSFGGLSEPSDVDKIDDPNVYKWRAGDLSIPEELVDHNLREFAQRRLYKGWIPARFREIDDRVFAFVHIDVDLYEPTKDSIAFFYERTVPGGIIVCDDYGFITCPGAHRAMKEFMSDKPEHVIHLTTGQGVIVKR